MGCHDFPYFKRHTLPFDSEPFLADELVTLIRYLEELPAGVCNRHLAVLNASSLGELRS